MAATLRFLNSKRHEEGTMQEELSKTTTALPRRAVLAGLAAAAPAAAIASLPSTVATEPDPIFAAIVAHERAAEAYSEALIAANLEAVELAAEADTEAALAMVVTVPTTLTGAIALMKYSMSGEHRYGCEWPHLFDSEDPDYEHAKTWNWFLQRTLIRSLEYIAAQSVTD
ncbi:hypothetical protein ABIE89_006450 [Bradyrhizobium niftali]|uniref:hypothetical protein n=1 Tax=Bradyrhizobium niftali TaxID=2560055 RepID=UPI0038357AD6